MKTTTIIDAVITWVDGSAPEHMEKRLKYLSLLDDASDITDRSSTDQNSELRWENNNEINICVRSIELYAPWIRKIWIVTDNQIPELSNISDNFRNRIEFINHNQIFREYSYKLPVFNSNAIESLIFRIPNLAENFIYFNDDFFLMGPCQPTDFFSADGKPVVRGHWVKSDRFNQLDFLREFRKCQFNAACLLFQSPSYIFLPAHVAYSFTRSQFSDLFEKFKSHFVKNISYRFRDAAQFQVVTLFSNSVLSTSDCVLFEGLPDFHQVTAGTIQRGDTYRVKKSLRALMRRCVKLGCINDVGELNRRFPKLYQKFCRTFSSSALLRYWSRYTLGLQL